MKCVRLKSHRLRRICFSANCLSNLLNWTDWCKSWPKAGPIDVRQVVPNFMVRNLLVWIPLLIPLLLQSLVVPIVGASSQNSAHQIKALQNSVTRLENIVRELNERLLETEKRLKNVEECDCYKSCSVNGSLHPDGSTWRDDCNICYCVSGEVKCRPIYCPVLCENPEIVANECCPVCKKTCYLNGQVLQHGQRIKITARTGKSDKCGECVCNDGKTSCKQIVADTMCPALNCPVEQQFSREGECCKFCEGTDFCGAGHECHPNATCHNLIAEYVCTCNEGFRGNGKTCQDINECQHKGGTDGHHCGQNAKCVNTSGSYKCQCVDGFKPLDKYQCSDVDECSDGSHDCSENSICINTLGGFECQCEDEYEIQGSICKPTGRAPDLRPEASHVLALTGSRNCMILIVLCIIKCYVIIIYKCK